MKKIIIIMMAVSTVNTVFGQVKNEAYNEMLKTLLSHTVNEIQVTEIDENNVSIIYLDAREKKEYEVSHIKNAIWIGYDDFKMKRIREIAKDKKIVIYCSVGYRSEKVAEKLVKAGYKDVSNLYGSIFEWVNQGRPVYDKDEKLTKNVHAYDHSWGVWLTKGEKIYR